MFHRRGDEQRSQTARIRRRHGLGEEDPGVGAVARAGAFDGHGHAKRPGRIAEGRHVAHPGGLVEVDCKEPTRLVRQQRVDTGREVSRNPGHAALNVALENIVGARRRRQERARGHAALNVALENIVSNRDKGLIRTGPTFDGWLPAYAADPFIATYRGITRSPSRCAFPAAGEHILAPAEQAAEYINLCSSGRLPRDASRSACLARAGMRVELLL